MDRITLDITNALDSAVGPEQGVSLQELKDLRESAASALVAEPVVADATELAGRAVLADASDALALGARPRHRVQGHCRSNQHRTATHAPMD